MLLMMLMKYQLQEIGNKKNKGWNIVWRFFDRRKWLLLRPLRKSENIKNLMESKFNVKEVSEELKQYDDLLKLS